MDITKDKLDVIFEMQEKLNQDIIDKRNLQCISDEEWIQKHMIAMFTEMAEVLEEINYKWWKNKKEVNKDNLKEELVDVLHFYVSMCLKAGMTSNELYEIYLKKNKENFDRQNGLSNKKGYSVNEG